MFGPLIAKPGSSRVNKTGSWRTDLKPKFLHKNCIGCKICSGACPEGCIIDEEKNNYSCDLSFCKGCGLCAILCPKADIVMVKEKEA
ncbi:MAG: 4Fe-4S binding protein [Candidatus Omnitrophica bacterium]|nr:4Fe-4S binding protein [Candidatus Omnitrophota bacterium]MDD5654502.1 4Fe-4S binding protein [Candidatus Omnitrophota bacterium]